MSEEAKKHGSTGIAFSVNRGCDLAESQTQREVAELLHEACPQLLVASPPQPSHRCRSSPIERARAVRQAKRQLQFCVDQVHDQLKRGGHFLLVHSLGSPIWKLPAMQNLKRRFGFHRVDMCAYGLQCPKTQLPIRRASGVAEWVSLMVAEACHGALDLRNHAQVRDRIPIIGITDCKSLYDAIHSVSSPAKLDDKRVAIDLAIIRQAKERTQMKVRWCPTELMLADSLTKDKADPADLLRAALHYGEYQLAPEARVLEQKRQQREARTAWSQASQGHR